MPLTISLIPEGFPISPQFPFSRNSNRRGAPVVYVALSGSQFLPSALQTSDSGLSIMKTDYLPSSLPHVRKVYVCDGDVTVIGSGREQIHITCSCHCVAMSPLAG